VDCDFLDSHRAIAEQAISASDLQELQKRVESWDYHTIFTALTERTILFADPLLEKSSVATETIDSAGCRAFIEEQAPHPIHSTKKPVPFQPPHRLLTYAQRKAIDGDLRRMKNLILNWKGPLSANALIFAFSKRHQELARVVEGSSSADRIQGRLHHTLGHFSPRQLHQGHLISDEDLASLSPSPRSQSFSQHFSNEVPRTPPPSEEPRTPSPVGSLLATGSPLIHRPTAVHREPQGPS
jgi:hypothetical protein